MHPRKEAGIVVDFVNKGATHNDRVISLHSLLGADFYREGARVTPAPRRRPNRRARRKLSPAPWLVPVTPDVRRRLAVIQREWQRIDPRYLDEDEQRYWASIAGRQVRFEERAEFVKKLSDGKASKACLEQFLATAAAENPNRRLRMMALSDRVSMTVERADFDDLVTLVIQGATWDKDRVQGARDPAAGDRRGEGGRAGADPRPLDVEARPGDAQGAGPPGRAPSSRRRSGCWARSRTLAVTATRRMRRSSSTRRSSCRSSVGVALLASADGYTPRATKLIEGAREKIGDAPRGRVRARREPAAAEGAQPARRRRRRRKKKGGAADRQTARGADRPRSGAALSRGSGAGGASRRRRTRPRPRREREPEPARAAEAS